MSARQVSSAAGISLNVQIEPEAAELVRCIACHRPYEPALAAGIAPSGTAARNAVEPPGWRCASRSTKPYVFRTVRVSAGAVRKFPQRAGVFFARGVGLGRRIVEPHSARKRALSRVRGAVYAKPTGGGTVRANPGCPDCGLRRLGRVPTQAGAFSEALSAAPLRRGIGCRTRTADDADAAEIVVRCRPAPNACGRGPRARRAPASSTPGSA